MPRYRNAADTLPPDMVALLQQYAAGEFIYVPRADGRAGWGTKSGARDMLAARNQCIRKCRMDGASVDQIAGEFHLSIESIRRILRRKHE